MPEKIKLKYIESVKAYSPTERSLLIIDELHLEKKLQQLKQASSAKQSALGHFSVLISAATGIFTSQDNQTLFLIWLAVSIAFLILLLQSFKAMYLLRGVSPESIIKDIKSSSAENQGHSSHTID